jgi:hypothetical protein
LLKDKICQKQGYNRKFLHISSYESLFNGKNFALLHGNSMNDAA